LKREGLAVRGIGAWGKGTSPKKSAGGQRAWRVISREELEENKKKKRYQSLKSKTEILHRIRRSGGHNSEKNGAKVLDDIALGEASGDWKKCLDQNSKGVIQGREM